MTQDTLALVLVVVALASLDTACSSRDTTEETGRQEETHGVGDPGENEGIVELPPEAAARIRIRVAPVEERALSDILETTGRVDFDQDRLAHVSPRVPGRVHRVLATLGDRVRAGQTLAIIDSIELGRARSDLLRARAQLDLAAQTLERERGLLEDRITSEQVVLEAQAAHQRALAEYQAARRELRLLGLSEERIDEAGADDPSAALFPLESPLSGTVVDKHVSLGEVVSPEGSLFTVADLSQVWIWVDVYERDLARVHLGDDVAVRVDALPEHAFEGKVAYIRDQIDPDTRTARARLDVANDGEHLRPGMFATVTVVDPHGTGGEDAPRVLVVPSGALQRDGDRHVAFVPVGDNRYERRVLTLGRRTGAYAEILDGLAVGEPVVVEGTFILKSEAAEHRMGGGHGH
jgi:cobalt-zinc-cadmium efflux system membrane fusion protein